MENENHLGYLKYSGKMVAEGYLDARKSAQALIGFDEAIRFYIKKSCPQLRDIDFELPIRVKKGSWEALIPQTIEQWIVTGAGTFLTTYGVTAAKKMADNDFKDIGLRDVFKKSIIAIQWFIKIGKHIGDSTQKRFKNLKWRNNNKEVGIRNIHGKYLFVPTDILNAYGDTNSKLLEKMSKIIEEERELSIGVIEDGQDISEKITIYEKHIFAPSEDDEEILFPELIHGQPVELEGYTTKGNQTANSIGFRYENHILTCYPDKGNIVRYKSALFLKCKIVGIVNRMDDKGNITERRPKIYFSDLLSIDEISSNINILDA